MVKRFIISPPASHRFRHCKCDRIVGSYTLLPRPGRWRGVLRTVRPVPGGWINSVGLRNCGIANVKQKPKLIYSVVGLEDGDWDQIFEHVCILWKKPFTLELNLSCPNVHEYAIPRTILRAICAQEGVTVIAKLPPTDQMKVLFDICGEEGVDYFHLSNTIPSPIGGISGSPLKQVNLPLVTWAAQQNRMVSRKAIPIIAGGGIYTDRDIKDYWNAGADHLSLCTVFFQPWKAYALLNRVSLR